MNEGFLILALASCGKSMAMECMILFHKALVCPVLKHLHEGTHYGQDILANLIWPYLKGPHLQKTTQRITQGCQSCGRNNIKIECKPAKKGAQHKIIFLFEDWQIDFTPKPKTTGSFKYLLVFVDTFSEWVEAYPTRTEQETDVVKILLK